MVFVKSSVPVCTLCCIFYGNCVVVGIRKGHLPVLDVEAGKVVTAEKRDHEGALWTVHVCNNCAVTVTGYVDGTVMSWNLDNNKRNARAGGGGDVMPLWFGRQPGEKRLVFVVMLNFNEQVFFKVSTSTDTNCRC